MEDIDATRKLRPPKAPDTSQPPLPLAAANPAVGSGMPPLPTSPVATPPPAEDLNTIRFVPHGSGNTPGYVVGSEPDPVTGWLVVMKGLGRGRSLPLGYGVHSVGRAEDQRVSVRFGDKKISRRSHVEVSYDGRGRVFYLTPGRGSTLGYLNGQPILQPTSLTVGDRISIGDTELMFIPFCNDSFDWQQEA